jgi:ribosomal protein L20
MRPTWAPSHKCCRWLACNSLTNKEKTHASRQTWCNGPRPSQKKVLALSKGFRGRRGNVFRIAKQAVMKAGQYAYRDRRAKKRVFRRLWIARINAAAAVTL